MAPFCRCLFFILAIKICPRFVVGLNYYHYLCICNYYKNIIHLIIYKSIMKKYVCTVCGYVYDPVEGDPDNGIEPGTAFEDIPDSWTCPVCGVSKEDFEVQED